MKTRWGTVTAIVDESGEDYLYPAEWFAAVELPRRVPNLTCVGRLGSSWLIHCAQSTRGGAGGAHDVMIAVHMQEVAGDRLAHFVVGGLGVIGEGRRSRWRIMPGVQKPHCSA